MNNDCTDKQVEDSVNFFVEVLDSVCKPLFEKNIPCDNQCQASDVGCYLMKGVNITS